MSGDFDLQKPKNREINKICKIYQFFLNILTCCARMSEYGEILSRKKIAARIPEEIQPNYRWKCRLAYNKPYTSMYSAADLKKLISNNNQTAYPRWNHNPIELLGVSKIQMTYMVQDDDCKKMK